MTHSTLVDDYQDWVGREEKREAMIAEPVVQAMAAALDLDSAPQSGEALPCGWQWLFFNPSVRRSGLGEDGHPARGGFLPPVALPRRMWAGSRISYLANIPVGAEAVRHSRILKVQNKEGSRGSLCFVTVEHTLSHGETVCVVEEQDIVYRDATPPGAPAPTPKPHEIEPQWSQAFVADSTLLFRYSALTFNGHRIHYDQSYAQNEEGYPDLVVHGPLTATLLQQFAIDHAEGRQLKQFDFRGVAPLIVNRPFKLEGRRGDGDTLEVWARGPQGELAMSATARFE
ncbi:MaoC family dehydratase N-terminal domain-containing protein [Halomonas sp. HMF6819]|uniref:FAS1-like dehydratase domain-containing protein n=1 Tax=Halomonas sp. HMF6819 TaxID=3373085 RepID=UPI00378D8157